MSDNYKILNNEVPGVIHFIEQMELVLSNGWCKVRDVSLGKGQDIIGAIEIVERDADNLLYGVAKRIVRMKTLYWLHHILGDHIGIVAFNEKNNTTQKVCLLC